MRLRMEPACIRNPPPIIDFRRQKRQLFHGYVSGFDTGMLTDRAFVLFDLERYEEALDWAQRARLSPHPPNHGICCFRRRVVQAWTA